MHECDHRPQLVVQRVDPPLRVPHGFSKGHLIFSSATEAACGAEDAGTTCVFRVTSARGIPARSSSRSRSRQPGMSSSDAYGRIRR
jgi:hypothetical protein